MTRQTFVLATTNPHKVREIRAMLDGVAVEIVGLDAFPPITAPDETGTTFAENARRDFHRVGSMRDYDPVFFCRSTGLQNQIAVVVGHIE